MPVVLLNGSMRSESFLPAFIIISAEWVLFSFDYAGFSVWRVDFKYNEELTQVFMSSNQIGGFFNRLEASRKYLFGSVGVLGTSGDSVISGVLILRGPTAEPVVNVAPDWESYTYTKLDVKDNAGDKTFFEGALAWDLEVNGKKWNDGKNVSFFYTPSLFRNSNESLQPQQFK